MFVHISPEVVTHDTQAAGSVQGHPQLYEKLEAILICISVYLNPSIKKQKFLGLQILGTQART